MIIVSQDKGKIINFDNMTRVYIVFYEGDDDVCIRTETVDSLYEDLGYYKTEARAKEVLQEIEKKICEGSNIKMDIEGINYEVSKQIYQMPER